MRNTLAVCLNPTLQRTFLVDHLWENEVLRSSEYYYDASGKGLNVARILTQLGSDAVHFTHVGGDYQEEYLRLNRESHLNIAYVETDCRIRTCYSIINAENSSTTEIVEEPLPVPPETEAAVWNTFSELLEKADNLVISGTIAPGYSQELYPNMVKKAKEEGKKVFLDIKGEPLKACMAYRPDFINPNFMEFAGTFLPDMEVKEHEDDRDAEAIVKEKMLEIEKEYGSVCIITHGSRPTLFVEEHQVRQSPVKRITPVNTIGSGDAFTAGFISIIDKGGSIGEAVHKGQECGAVNALHIRPGTLR